MVGRRRGRTRRSCVPVSTSSTPTVGRVTRRRERSRVNPGDRQKGKRITLVFFWLESCSHVVKKEQPKVTVSEIGIFKPPTIERMLNWV